MKYLIVGTGNPGAEYDETRHNIGFKALDALQQASNFSFEHLRYADVCRLKHKGRLLICIKPMTYMNLSGKAVDYWLKKENIPIERCLVIVDDIALPFGTIRIKKKGSDGGHNGLKHIASTLGHTNYPRLRFGIGNDYSKGAQVDFVLSRWTTEEALLLPERLQKISSAVKSFVTIGLDRTMNLHNDKFDAKTALDILKKKKNSTDDVE
ncbi:MAG: aminoacyl-tRNA hydrolase [Bacteroidia bacterium]|nr:MAG: aminoacyl-tRNA hydrolase [Bacteroidia bacterium]